MMKNSRLKCSEYVQNISKSKSFGKLVLIVYIKEAINFPGYNWFDANWIESNFDSTQGIYVFSCRFQIGKGAILHSKQYWYYTHCPKMKINGQKPSKFQFRCHGCYLVACPMLKKRKKKIVPTAIWDISINGSHWTKMKLLKLRGRFQGHRGQNIKII